MTKEQLIERMRAYKKYLTSGNPIWSVEEVAKDFDIAIKALKQKPSATPTREKAKWIKLDNGFGCKCSHCNQPKSQLYENFCGNCGAEMESEEN